MAAEPETLPLAATADLREHPSTPATVRRLGPGLPVPAVGLGFAVVGQYFLGLGREPGVGAALYILGGFLIGWHSTLQARPAYISGKALPTSRWFVLASVALLLPALGLLAVVQRQTAYMHAYAVGLYGLVATAVWLDRHEHRWTVPSLASREVLLVGGLLLASLFARLWLWDTVPPAPQIDDAELGLKARGILEGRPSIPFLSAAWRNPEIHQLLIAQFMRLTHDGVLGLTLAGAVPGTLAVLLLYLLVRGTYGVGVALAAAALFAFNRWSVLLSRLGSDFALSLALTLGAGWLAWRALRTGRAIWFVLTGLVCGVALIYFYLALVAPLLVAAIWLFEGRRDLSRGRAGLAGLALAAFVALCVFAPRAYVIYSDPALVAYIGSYAAAGPTASEPSALQQAIQVALGLVYRSIGRPTHMFDDQPGPLLDPLSAGLAMLGVGYLIAGVAARRPWSAVWLTSGILGIAIAASTRGLEASSYRTAMILPIAAVGGGLVLVSVARALPGSLRMGRLALVVGAISFVALATYRDYFVGFQEREIIWRSTGASEVTAGRWMQTATRKLILLAPEVQRFGLVGLTAPPGLTGGPDVPHTIGDQTDIPFPVSPSADAETVALLLAPEPWDTGSSTLIDELARRYYGEARNDERALAGRPVLRVQEWERDAVERRQGLARVGDASCPASGGAPADGWRGLLYVPDHGPLRLRADGATCAAIGTRGVDALGASLYLSRGWHELTLVGPATVPRLSIERDTRSQPVPPEHLFRGGFEPIGFLARFAAAPGAPPFERRYLPTFETNWSSNPPGEGQTFYVELAGTIRLERAGEHWLQGEVDGPFTFLLDGQPIVTAPTRFSERRNLSAGEHRIEIRYHARSLAPTRLRLYRTDEPPRRLDFAVVSPPANS